MRIRRLIAGLAGVSTTASLLAIGAPSASASSFEATNCNKYPIGSICVVRGWDSQEDRYYFYGRYKNSGASEHLGHIDLYVDSSNVYVGDGHDIDPGASFNSFRFYVSPGSSKVRADFVNSNGSHYKSPTKTESSGL